MELITAPYFSQLTRSYSYSEVQALLAATTEEMTDLIATSILCRNYKMGFQRSQETEFHSVLDILAAYLYQNVAVGQEGKPTRHLLGVVAVHACESKLQDIEIMMAPETSSEFEGVLSRDRILKRTGLVKYSDVLSAETVRFWRKLRTQINGFRSQ